MGFVVKNNKGSYIGNIQRFQGACVDSEQDAQIFKRREAATNFLIARRLSGFRVYQYVEPKEPAESVESVEPAEPAEVIKVSVDVGLEESMVTQLFNSIYESYQKLIEIREGIDAQLSHYDMCVSDLEHAIEFYDYNASLGFKMYKDLQGILRKRRYVKNEMVKLNAVSSLLGSDFSYCLDTIHKRLNQEDKKVYTPRVLDNLFKNGLSK